MKLRQLERESSIKPFLSYHSAPVFTFVEAIGNNPSFRPTFNEWTAIDLFSPRFLKNKTFVIGLGRALMIMSMRMSLNRGNGL